MAKKKSATRRILKIVGGLVLVLVLIGAIGTWAGLFGGGGDGVAVETTEAQRRDITQTVTAFGRVQPEVDVTISPDVPGEIISLPVKEGDHVEAGDLLARIEAKDYLAQTQQQRAGVQQAQASLQQRKADLRQAKQEYERKKRLYEREMISEQEYQAAASRYEQAQAQTEAARFGVKQAQARLEESQERVQQTAIHAPISGTVSKLSVEEGERVVGTDRQPGTEMMRIARLGQMEVEVDVNENDVINIVQDDTASIEVDAYPERSFSGVVTEIANSARISGEGTQEQVTNFPVKARILTAHNLDEATRGGLARPVSAGTTRAGGALRQETAPRQTSFGPEGAPTFRPGMSATVDIFTETVEDAVAVPIQAVTVRDFNEVQPADEEGKASADSSGKGSERSSPQKRRSGAGGAEDLRKVVFTMEDGQAQMVEVETGISDDTHIEIVSGLSGGETVITGPYSAVSRQLRPGMDVRVRGGGGGRRRGGQEASL